MKETLSTQVLRDALTKCGVAVKRRSKLLGINGNLVVESYENVVRIKSTDLESYVITTIKHPVAEPFKYCLPAKPFLQFVGKGNDQTSLSYSGGKKIVVERSQVGRANLWMGTEVKDYPPEPIYNVEWYTLPKEFCRMMGIMLMGCALGKSRPVLTAVCVSDGKMASADGFRLYFYENKEFIFGLGNKQALIPNTVASKAIKLFGKDENVEIGFDLIHSFVAFRSGGTTLLGCLIQGSYPRYQQLIPATYQSKVSFSVPLMMERLSMVEWIAKQGSGTVRFVSTKGVMKEDLCVVSSGSEELANCEVELPVEIQILEGGKIAFNYKYIQEAIKPFSMCQMEITTPSSPAKFTGDIEGLAVVVMPMFVKW